MSLGTLATQNGTISDYATLVAVAAGYQPLAANLTTFAAKTPPSGVIIGTTDTQTLTNKTLTSPVINVASDATGDIYYRNAGGLFTRLPIGTNTHVLTVAGGVPTWAAPSGGGGGTYLAGTGLTLTGGDTFAINSVVVTTSGTQTLTNKTLTSPVINMFANDPGDIYYRNGSNQTVRLPIGSGTQVLTVAGGYPIWADAPTASGGGGGSSWAEPIIVTSDGVTLPAATNTTILIDCNSTGVYRNLPLVEDGIGPITFILIDNTNNANIVTDEFGSDSFLTNYGYESIITLTQVGDFVTFEPGPSGSQTWYLKVDGRRGTTTLPTFNGSNLKMLICYGTNAVWTDTTDYLKISGLATDVAVTNSAGFLQSYMTTIIGDATSGSFRHALPDTSTLEGKIYTFYKKDSSANYFGMDGDGSQTINGALTYDLVQQGESVTIQCIEGNWKVINSNRNTNGIPQVSKSANYTCVISDNGRHILHPSADTTARTFTIPANVSVPYPIGAVLTFVNQNAGGVITIAITSDTMRLAGAGTTGDRSLAANGIAFAVKVTSTEWLIYGTGLT